MQSLWDPEIMDLCEGGHCDSLDGVWLEKLYALRPAEAVRAQDERRQASFLLEPNSREISKTL